MDALVATSFALGVLEPEASGIGGDGAAVLYLKGMKQPTVIDYKDMTPIRATPDNPAILATAALSPMVLRRRTSPASSRASITSTKSTGAARSPGSS